VAVDEVTVWECVACEGRGRTAEDVRHVIVCNDRDELRKLTFELGTGPARPLF
jgi:hypothetical protein